MKKSIDLSLVLDMETRKITGALLLDQQLQLLREAVAKIAPRTYELIICSSLPLEEKIDFPPEIRVLVLPGQGYYAMKNAGAALARGKIISFVDFDCRCAPDYFVRLLHYFARMKGNILGGRTFYEGEDFRSRALTVTAFGYLHQVKELPVGSTYVAHNVAVRKGFFEQPFGPYTDRYGGDMYLTLSAQQRGEPAPVKEDLIIYHESAGQSWRALLDRNIRELVGYAFEKKGHRKLTSWLVLKVAYQEGRRRWRLFKRLDSRLGFGAQEKGRAYRFFHALIFFDVLCALGLVLNPKFFAGWLRYQFGNVQTCLLVREAVAQRLSLEKTSAPGKRLSKTGMRASAF